MKGFFIAGNNTDVGKTVVSAILVEALKADYWKPVQSGDLEDSDRRTVQELVSNSHSVFHPEHISLPQPISPHAAAELEGKEIKLQDLKLPETSNTIIVESAGGIMTPINYQDSFLDLAEQLQLPVLLVSRHYLGSINHTLLTISVLKTRGIPVQAILFNGKENKASESVILHNSDATLLGRLEDEERIDKKVVSKYALRFEPALKSLLLRQ